MEREQRGRERENEMLSERVERESRGRERERERVGDLVRADQSS